MPIVSCPSTWWRSWRQRRGFRMTALYPGAIDALRAFAPTLKTPGADGVPARDIVELEIDL